MILKFLKEDIQNQKLNNEYTRAYSDIPEEDFMLMVKMDPNSYPKGTTDYANTEPDRVGNLAGGNGILIRCYRKGEKDFLKNFKEVQDACDKYSKNRGRYSIKNAAQFPSVKDFVDYVKADGNIELTGVENTAKKENTPTDKLEQLRQKQFPKIENVEKLIEIANLDPDSDTEHGQVGNLAKTLLLPHYNNGDTKFLNKKNSLAKAIIAYSNASDEELKSKPIASYNERNENGYVKKVADFILDWYPAAFGGKSNYAALLNHYADTTEYEWVCDTPNYQVIKFWTKHVGYITDYCDIPIEVFEKKYGDKKDAPDLWATDVGNAYYEADDPKNMVTNTWCTGWGPGHTGEEHLRQYFDTASNSLFTFIKKNRVPFTAENASNWLVSLTNDGYLRDIADGTDIQGITAQHKRNFQNMLRNNRDILPYLLNYPAAKNSDLIQTVVKEKPNDFENTDVKLAKAKPEVDINDWENDVEEEAKPFIYSKPEDVKDYKNKTNDNSLGNIQNLVIADGVTEIPDFMFQGCKNLRSIKFPSSLVKIGNKSFANCESLLKITLPENLEEIGLGAFEGCTSLRGSIRLPISLKKINQNAFSDHNKKGVKFVISPKKLTPDNYLLLPKEDHDFWFTPGRIKFSDN